MNSINLAPFDFKSFQFENNEGNTQDIEEKLDRKITVQKT